MEGGLLALLDDRGAEFGPGMGRLSARAVHRVVTPPAGTDRLSIALFLGARLDSTVPVLTLSPALAAEARGVSQDPHNPLFRDVGKNYLKGRLRSHPDVARRHHADLLSAEEKRASGPGSAY